MTTSPPRIHRKWLQQRTLSAVVILLSFATHSQSSHINTHYPYSCSPTTFEFLLSTSTIHFKPCSSSNHEVLGAIPCPTGSSAGDAVAVASVVACSEQESEEGIDPQFGDSNESCHLQQFNATCRASFCACNDEDDDDCLECASGRSRPSVCSATQVDIPSYGFCLRLTTVISPSLLSSHSMYHASSSAGQHPQLHDRIIFKLFFETSPTMPALATPALGPWSFGTLNRWILSHASDDDHLAAMDLSYAKALHTSF